jgi:hypothetical protein
LWDLKAENAKLGVNRIETIKETISLGNPIKSKITNIKMTELDKIEELTLTFKNKLEELHRI